MHRLRQSWLLWTSVLMLVVSIMALLYLGTAPLQAQTTKRALMQEDIGYVNVLQYGSAFTASTLQAAITAIGASKRVLFLSTGAWVIGSNITVPANIRLFIPASSTVSVQSGITLTLYNDPIVDQPAWRTGTGTLTVIARHGHVYARDYGVLCDDSTDDATALAAAITDTPEGGTLELPSGICRFSTQIVLANSITLQGQGMADSDTSPGSWRGTVLRSTASIAIGMGNASALATVNLREMVILNPSGPSNLGVAAGASTYGLSKCVWRNVIIAGWSTGLQLGVTGTGTIVDSSFHGVYFRSNTVPLTVGTGSTNNTFYNDTIFSTGMLFANLANPFGSINGTMIFCSDCSYGSNPCTGGGNGAWATRSASLWKC